MLAVAPLGQELAQSVEVGALSLRHGLGELVELEQVDVQVAAGPGRLLDPLEVGAEALELLRREHLLQLALQRAGPAHRHAQVVQELRVEIGERAWQVRLDHGQQAQRQRLRSSVGRHVRRELDAVVGRKGRC